MRSKDAVIEPEKQPQISTKWAEKEKEILLNDKLLKQEKNALLTIVKMRQLAEKETAKGNQAFEGIKHQIDNKGTVIFTLSNGKTLCDTGKAVYFGKDKQVEDVAIRYAQSKWGNRAQLKDNQVVFAFPHTEERKKTLKLNSYFQ